MNSLLFILFLLFLLLVGDSLPVVDASAHSDIVQDTCKKCSTSDRKANYTLCMAYFNAVPKSHRADLPGLGVIAAKLAAANAKLVRSKVKTLLKSNTKGRYFTSCLKTCLELYSDSVSSLKDSVRAIRTGQYGDANIMISAAVNAPGVCEDGFGEGGFESPLTKENVEFFGRTVIALDVTTLLQGHVS